MRSLTFLNHAEHRLVLEILAKGGEGRFVGSAVRDSLAGNLVLDFDIATTHPPDSVCRLFKSHAKHIVKSGMAYGTITVHLQEYVYEITTLRSDVACDGRHARVQFTNLWEKDAARRDFTFNALYLDAKGQLYDYYEGVKDLQEGVVRFIGDPAQRIQEDYLRILRFFRFAARYGHGHFHRASLHACLDYKNNLAKLSRERVNSEMQKLRAGPFLEKIVTLFQKENFWELLGGQPVRTLKRWSALFALESASGLRADFLTYLHSIYAPSTPSFILRRFDRTFYKMLGESFPTFEGLDDLLALWPVVLSHVSFEVAWGRLWLTLADHLCVSPEKKDWFVQCLKRVHAEDKPISKRFPLSGEDIINLGVMPGPKVAVLMTKARMLWEESRGQAKREDLLALIKKTL